MINLAASSPARGTPERLEPTNSRAGNLPGAVVKVGVPRGPGAVEGKGQLLVVLVLLTPHPEGGEHFACRRTSTTVSLPPSHTTAHAARSNAHTTGGRARAVLRALASAQHRRRNAPPLWRRAGYAGAAPPQRAARRAASACAGAGPVAPGSFCAKTHTAARTASLRARSLPPSPIAPAGPARAARRGACSMGVILYW